MVINTNMAAETGARLLAQSTSLLDQSLARPPSGSKIVSPADDAAGHRSAGHDVGPQTRTPRHPVPTGPPKEPRARRWPRGSISRGTFASGRPAGPNSTVPPVAGSNVE